MNDAQLIGAIHSAMYDQCQRRGYAAPVDVLMDIGVLPKKQYEAWRNGKISYLESVCTVNLHKLSFIMKQIRLYAQKQGWKPSFCYYKQCGLKKESGQGRKPVVKLRFSKSSNPEIERSYATHFVDLARTSQLKTEKQTPHTNQEQP